MSFILSYQYSQNVVFLLILEEMPGATGELCARRDGIVVWLLERAHVYPPRVSRRQAARVHDWHRRLTVHEEDTGRVQRAVSERCAGIQDEFSVR